MQVKTLLLAVCWMAVSFSSFARDKIALSPANTRSLKFVRNDGQLKNQHGHLRPELHSRMKAGSNLNVFTGAGLLVYQWQGSDMMYRMEASLVGAKATAQPVYEMPLSYTERYIGNGKEITARSCGRIVYPNVYPNIDWVLYTTTDGHLKYDFIVHPGGKVSDIQIKYSGATAISLQQDGSLSVQTPMGSIGEHAPVSYTREGKAVGSRFVLSDSVVSFQVDDYSGTLVIDPELSWSTYYGGLGDDNIDDISIDQWGNTYVSGYTLSLDNIATTGAFQTTYSGSDLMFNVGDAFIAKYNCSGEQLWATYYGGEAAERAWNIAADDYGHIYVAGFTNLLSGMPSTDNLATTGSHQSTPGGGDGDLFLVKFDSAGNRIWATYYGGSGRENTPTIPAGLALDKNGHVYLCGTTNSTSAIATTGAHQATPGGGNDAFLVQFDTAGVRQWATYYGGTGADRATSLACDTAGNIYMSGMTISAANIASTGAHQATSGGSNDAFLVKFNDSGVRQWGTYYGGTGNADEGMSLYTDTALNVYMAGRTNSTTGISSAGSFQSTYGGGMSDAFLVKFNASGTRQWGTYFGGLNNGSILGYNTIAGNLHGNIFITGMAKTIDSLATSGSFQETVAGAEDGFIAQFDMDGSLDWATYYGGAGSDFFNAIAADPLGNLYLAGCTTSDAAFTTAGSEQPFLNGGYDAFLLKFSDTSYMPSVDTVHGSTVVCAGTEQVYEISAVPGAIAYTWTLPSGWTGTSDSTSIIVTLGDTSGMVQVAPVFPCADGSGYSLMVEVIKAVATPFADTTGCYGDTLRLDANTGDAYSWQWLQDGAELAGASDSILQTGSSGLYRVIISKGGCADTSDAVSLTIHDLPLVAITRSGDTLYATGGYSGYQWTHENIVIAGAVNDYFVPAIDGNYSVIVTDSNGCEGIAESVPYEEPTDITIPELRYAISIFPNPANDIVHITSSVLLTGRVTTIDGRLVKAIIVPGSIDISELPEGIYLLTLSNTESGFSKAYKLVKTTHN
jgi:hypothetical protein